MMFTLSKSLLMSLALSTTTVTLSAAAASSNSKMMTSAAGRVDEIRALVNRAQEEHHHRRRLTQDMDFGQVCELFEEFVSDDFVCSCDDVTSTLICETTVCEGNDCGKAELTMDFNDDLEIDYVQICIKFLDDAADAYPDICVRTDVNAQGEMESCSVQLEKNNSLQTCKQCAACEANGKDGMILDCSNLYADATTGGCSTGDIESSQSDNPGRIIQQRAASDMGNDGGSSAASYGMISLGMVLGVLGMQGLM